MFEQFMVTMIICFAVFFVGRRIHRVFTEQNPGCGCGSNGCPLSMKSDKDNGHRCGYDRNNKDVKAGVNVS